MSIATHFGAVGDGQKDDTRALQHAIDDGDGTLDLPRGTYRITAPLVLDTTRQGYLGIRGAQGTARIVMTGPGPAIRVIGGHDGTAHPSSVQAHVYDMERFPVLSGFEVVGAHPEADGVEVFKTMKCVIQNVLIRECRYGIHVVERNRNLIVANSHIYNGADSGVFLDNVNLHQVNIIGNHISYCKRAGIRQLNGDVHNIQITGNDIEYNSGFDGMSGEILLEVPGDGVISEYTIASNTIQATPDVPGANVVLIGRPGTDGSCIGQIAITGNVLGSRDKNILIEHGFRAITIAGNTIYTGSSANVHLKHGAQIVMTGNTIVAPEYPPHLEYHRGGVILEDCANCLIADNLIHYLMQGDASQGGAVTLTNCTDVTVRGCEILDPTVRGVYLKGCTGCIVSGNRIVDRRPAPTMLASVHVAYPGNANLVQNNYVNRPIYTDIAADQRLSILKDNTSV